MLVKRSPLFFGSMLFTLAFAGFHCSSSSTSGGGTDGGTASDSGGADSGGGVDSSVDAGRVTNECDNTGYDANDETAANATRTITFPMDLAPVQFSPHCMKIKAGQSVTWNGQFPSHPLEAMGGDTGNPIPPTSTGMTVSVTFPNAGTFGFDCANHPSMMHGAILVVP
jgi:plastocyanin